MRAVRHIENESKSHITFDPTRLRAQLHDIHQQWHTPHHHQPTLASTVQYRQERAAKDFRDITVVVAPHGISVDDNKVFLLCRPIITDIINRHMRDTLDAYTRDVSNVEDTQDNLLFWINYTIKNIPGRLRDTEQLLQRYLNTYPVAHHWQHLDNYFTQSANTELWKDAATGYYRNTGIITTNQEIHKLATLRRLEAIFQNIAIRVRTTTPNDRRV